MARSVRGILIVSQLQSLISLHTELTARPLVASRSLVMFSSSRSNKPSIDPRILSVCTLHMHVRSYARIALTGAIGMVHPCGSGAFGHFETTQDVTKFTKVSCLLWVSRLYTHCNRVQAHFLGGVGRKTPVFVRFSTVTLGREFPDLARNPRGFAIKFYTGEGNYDIVGLNFVCVDSRIPLRIFVDVRL